jgi:hypothetical protein
LSGEFFVSQSGIEQFLVGLIDSCGFFEACHCFALSWFSGLFYPFFTRRARVTSEDSCRRGRDS